MAQWSNSLLRSHATFYRCYKIYTSVVLAFSSKCGILNDLFGDIHSTFEKELMLRVGAFSRMRPSNWSFDIHWTLFRVNDSRIWTRQSCGMTGWFMMFLKIKNTYLIIKKIVERVWTYLNLKSLKGVWKPMRCNALARFYNGIFKTFFGQNI